MGERRWTATLNFKAGARTNVPVSENEALTYREEEAVGRVQSPSARLEGDPLRVAKWDTLFIDRYSRGAISTNWSVFPSGREFLMIGSGGERGDGVKLVVNWPQLRGSSRGVGEP